tara:strand:- start:977 stop:1504 length:528 start_codon:yes stop_codon:yes gene_type:complete
MDFYNAVLIVFVFIIVLGVFKGFGENRSIIVFRDYDDLGLTFLVPTSFFLITYIFTMLGGNQNIGMLIGGIVAVFLFIKLVKNTYTDNGGNIGKCALALITKLPLAIIWIFNLIQLLNPSGTGSQRRKSRGQALVILTLLTPIIGMLVVDKSGSYFNPKSWIKGRRVGPTIRNGL